MNTPSIDAQDRLIAGYAALAVAVQLLEAGFPSPLPGIKPGLANVVTLIVLLRHGWTSAAWVSGLRVLLGSLLLGSFLAPGFWLSASGAAGALAALWLGAQLRGLLRLSPVGLSVLAAQAHLLAQFALARIWLIPHADLLRLLPPLLAASLLFGIASGLVAARILRHLRPATAAPPADSGAA